MQFRINFIMIGSDYALRL